MSGHKRDPNHTVEVQPTTREVHVAVDGRTIARTRRALALSETGYPVRYYIPPDDVRMELLEPTERTSVCPYKGRASYWSVRVDGRVVDNAVWAYLDPIPQCAAIKGHLSFYPEKVELKVADQAARVIAP